MVITRRRVVSALCLVVGLGACTDGDGDAEPEDAGTTTATTVATVPGAATDDGDLEAAFEFAACMRDNGVPDFADPQLRADGDYFLEPPADVGNDELSTAEAACGALLGPPSTGPASHEGDVDDGWERVVPGGDCQCSDGSPFRFWVRPANPDHVVLYLQGGGACFSAETCAPDRELFRTTADGPPGEGGIFDVDDARNPFAGHSVVYVPYCTGDVHLGNTTTDYGPALRVQHKGLVNGTAVLDHLAARFPDATEVVVAGESAGSIAAPLYGGLVTDRLSDARVTVLADGSGSYPAVPRLNEIIAAWGIGDATTGWSDIDDVAGEQWSVPGLFVHSGTHAPDMVLARHDYAYDENQQSWFPLAGLPAPDLLALIDENEAQIERAGVELLSYIAPGDAHTVLSDGSFYTETVDGVQLVDWVRRLVEGEPVDDVHCTECTAD